MLADLFSSGRYYTAPLAGFLHRLAQVSPQEIESLNQRWSAEMDNALRAGIFRYGAAWEKAAGHVAHPCSAVEAEKRYTFFWVFFVFHHVGVEDWLFEGTRHGFFFSVAVEVIVVVGIWIIHCHQPRHSNFRSSRNAQLPFDDRAQNVFIYFISSCAWEVEGGVAEGRRLKLFHWFIRGRAEGGGGLEGGKLESGQGASYLSAANPMPLKH